MKPYRVFVGYPIRPEAEAALATFCEFEKWTGAGRPGEDDLIQKSADVDGLLIDGPIKITRRLLEQSPRLRIVSNASVGYNNFDLAAMRDHRIIGTNVSGALDDSVADLAMALVICCGRRICALDRFVKDGLWQPGDDSHLFGQDIHNRTLGIIGMGRIGEALARRAVFGFGMSLLYCNRNRRPDVEACFGAAHADLDSLLERADYVVMLTPATPETRHLMGKAQFVRMKRTAFFINVSRGPNVDEAALAEAVQNGIIAGAGLDVYDGEPVNPESPLLKLPNIVTLPHIGSATAETRLCMTMTAVENLRQGLLGEKPALTVPELR